MVDQLSKLSQFMEKHLVIMMLSKPSQLKEKISVLEKTKMVDALSDAYAELYGKPPSSNEFEVLEERANILKELEDLEKKVKPLLNSKEDLISSELSSLKSYAKLQYEVGDYDSCAIALEEIRRADKRDSWGELTVSILLGRKEVAMNLIESLHPELNEATEKAWLLHLSLFLSFPDSPGFFLWVSGLTKFSYTIEMVCPHLIRYVVSSMLLKKSVKLIDFLQNFSQSLGCDAFLKPFSELVSTYDFKKVFEYVEVMGTEAKNDYFLEAVSDKIVYEAKKFFVYCYAKINFKTSQDWICENTKEDSAKIIEEIINDYQISLHLDGGCYKKVDQKAVVNEKIRKVNDMISQTKKILSSRDN